MVLSRDHVARSTRCSIVAVERAAVRDGYQKLLHPEMPDEALVEDSVAR